MKQESNDRHIAFQGVYNFRDLGGYRTHDGRRVQRGQVFRSGELQHMSESDAIRFREEIHLASVLDLRHPKEIDQHGIGRIRELGISHKNISFTGNPHSDAALKQYQASSNMGEFYLHLFKHTNIGLRVSEALEILADPGNRPLVFHCVGGKDRTGILAAITLSLLGVSNADIIEDYALTEKHMPILISRISRDLKRAALLEKLPHFVAEASAESMASFLESVQQEHGSIMGLMKGYGVSNALTHRLRSSLLTD